MIGWHEKSHEHPDFPAVHAEYDVLGQHWSSFSQWLCSQFFSVWQIVLASHSSGVPLKPWHWSILDWQSPSRPSSKGMFSHKQAVSSWHRPLSPNFSQGSNRMTQFSRKEQPLASQRPFVRSFPKRQHSSSGLQNSVASRHVSDTVHMLSPAASVTARHESLLRAADPEHGSSAKKQYDPQ